MSKEKFKTRLMVGDRQLRDDTLVPVKSVVEVIDKVIDEVRKERTHKTGQGIGDLLESGSFDGVSLMRLPPPPSRQLIKLSPEFHERPVRVQLKYLHELASTLNNALDIMQRERNQVIEANGSLENLVRSQQQQIAQLAAQLQMQVTAANTKAESRVQEIMELKVENRRLKSLIE